MEVHTWFENNGDTATILTVYRLHERSPRWYEKTFGLVFVRMECPAWCSGGRRPLIAALLSLQRIGMDLPVTRPVWDSKLGPPDSESRPLGQLSCRRH